MGRQFTLFSGSKENLQKLFFANTLINQEYPYGTNIQGTPEKDDQEAQKEKKRKRNKNKHALRAQVEARGDKVAVCWHGQSSCDMSS